MTTATGIELSSLRLSQSGSLLHDAASDHSSLRSVFDDSYCGQRRCDVYIRDYDPSFELDLQATHYECSQYTVYGKRIHDRQHQQRQSSPSATNADTLSRLLARLQARDASRTRWINIVGWSKDMVEAVANCQLGCKDFLSLDGTSQQMFGGPIQAGKDNHFIWLQTQLWFAGDPRKVWSSLRQINLCMIVCLPTHNHAGTIITNFVGASRLTDEVSRLITERVLSEHPLGRRSLICPWVLAFAILQAMIEYLDFVFELLDPIELPADRLPIPYMDDLPAILAKTNKLARIERYLSSMDEMLSFFQRVRQLFAFEGAATDREKSTLMFQHARAKIYADLESSKASDKTLYKQRLCKTYRRQFEHLVQMTLSHSIALIGDRLDEGRRMSELTTKIAIAVACVASIVAPLSVLTGFFGMNVAEFVPGTSLTLFDFWKTGLPVMLVTAVPICLVLLWTVTHKG